MDTRHQQALMMALRKNSKAKSALDIMNEEYARNKSLRDTPFTQANKYGYTSPLQSLSEGVMRFAGQRNIRANKAGRAAARQEIGDTEHAFKKYQVGVNARNAAQQQTNFGVTSGLAKSRLDATNAQNIVTNERANKAIGLAAEHRVEDTLTDKTALELKATQRAEEQLQTATAPVEYSRGKERMLLSRREDGKWINGKGEVQESIAGWSVVPKATITSDGSTYRDKTANARAEASINAAGAINRVMGLRNDLSPATAARLDARSTRIGKTAMRALLPKDVSSFMASEIEKDPAAKHYFSALAQMSSVERHAMFGAALTAQELKSADDFIAFVINLPLAEQQQRMQNSVAKSLGELRTGDSLYGNGQTNYMDAYNRMGYTHLNFATPEPQEGSVNALRDAAAEDPMQQEIAAEEAYMREYEAKHGIKP